MSFCACAEAKYAVFSLFPTQPNGVVAEESCETMKCLSFAMNGKAKDMKSVSQHVSRETLTHSFYPNFLAELSHFFGLFPRKPLKAMGCLAIIFCVLICISVIFTQIMESRCLCG